jgi:hypothetical protein
MAVTYLTKRSAVFISVFQTVAQSERRSPGLQILFMEQFQRRRVPVLASVETVSNFRTGRTRSMAAPG